METVQILQFVIIFITIILNFLIFFYALELRRNGIKKKNPTEVYASQSVCVMSVFVILLDLALTGISCYFYAVYV